MNPKKLKELRLKKGYTLAYMGEKTGLTKGYLSLLERGLREPSLESMRIISQFLEVPLFAFFTSEKHIQPLPVNVSDKINGDMCSVIYNNNRSKLAIPDIIAKYELLTPVDQENKEDIIGLYAEQEPSHWSAENMVTHNYDESIFILKGTIKFYVGENVYELKEGDSIYIRKHSPHNAFNCGEDTAKFVNYMIKTF